MQKLTLHDIIDAIKRQNGISDFKIVNTKKQSHELFFVHGKLETLRKAESESSVVTLYVAHDGKLGNSSFEATASLMADELENKLAAARENALLIFDEPYELPENLHTDGVLESNLRDMPPFEVAAKVASAVKKANETPGCDVNALEVFVVKTTTRVINSRNVDCSEVKYTVNLEAIPTANGEKQSVELFETYSFSELDEDLIACELSARLKDVAARLEAVKPAKKLTCPVIFNAYELNELFGELIFNANFASVYSHANTLEKGDALQSAPAHDKLNVTMRGKIKGCPASALFDENDGCPLADRQIIKDGKLAALYGSHRFAQYLGEEPTGNLGCIEVECGTCSEEELAKGEHLELVYMSGLQVDVYNDYIGGEIRLAYYFDGNKRVPVTSIAMSGKLSDVLNTVRLSNKQTISGAYVGPSKMLADGFNIF